MCQDRRAKLMNRFFSGVTEYAFQSQLGVVDPPLVDYISELLIRFVHADDIYSVRSVRGIRLTQVADMLAEAQARQGTARRKVHRHIGDFILFWTGVYPEIADRMQSASSRDSLLDYHAQGKKAYYIASTIAVDQNASVQTEATSSEILQRLSNQFDLCVYGLSEVRRQWEQPDGDFELPLII
ncbi:MAG: hypothetical protein ABGX16_09275 [Pirellulales bacterium]